MTAVANYRNARIASYTPCLPMLVLCLSAQAPPPINRPSIQPEQKTDGTVQDQGNAEQEARRSLPAPSETPSLPPTNHASHEGEQGSEEGTEFWPSFLGYRVKITDSLLVVFTAVLAIVTMGLWVSTHRLWKAGERQIELVKTSAESSLKSVNAAIEANEFNMRAFNITQRPWVSIAAEEVASPLIFEERQSVINLNLTLKNTGAAPALRVAIWPKIYFMGYGGMHPIAVRREFMEPLRRMPAHMASEGHALFSGEEFKTEMAFNINQAQVRKVISDEKSATLIIIAVVHYQSGVGEDEHCTGTIYYLHRRVADGWVIDFDPRNGSIDAADLKISRHPMGTIAD